jgi:hypothetical protein
MALHERRREPDIRLDERPVDVGGRDADAEVAGGLPFLSENRRERVTADG